MPFFLGAWATWVFWTLDDDAVREWVPTALCVPLGAIDGRWQPEEEECSSSRLRLQSCATALLFTTRRGKCMDNGADDRVLLPLVFTDAPTDSLVLLIGTSPPLPDPLPVDRCSQLHITHLPLSLSLQPTCLPVLWHTMTAYRSTREPRRRVTPALSLASDVD